MNTDESRSFSSDDERADDLDYLDYLGSFEAETEPAPAMPSGRKSLTNRRSRRKSKNKDAESLLEEYKADYLELHQVLDQILKDKTLNAEAKQSLIETASKRAGVTIKESKIVQLLLESHLDEKYGTKDLLVVSSDSSSNWFDGEETHLIDTLLMCNDLNIIGGLSGASKTTLTSMMVSALLQKKSSFLGFKVNHQMCEKVFFIGLDGGKNVYRPIFQKAGLLTDSGPIENFYFIPNESGWSMSSTNLDKLEELIKGTKNSVVIVDSLLAATTSTGVDENSAQMAGRLLDLKLVCERHGATPIVLAHQKKEATQELIGSGSLRGHSSIPCFAGGIITLNFLDQQAKVNGKSVPDRKSPKRRLFAGYRTTPADLLVEIDFDNASIKSHGDFYDALYSVDCSEALDQSIDGGSILSHIKGWTTNKSTILDALRGSTEPVSQSYLEQTTGINKGTISRTIKALMNERFQGNCFVEAIDIGSGQTLYCLNHLIHQKLNDDY